MISIGLYELKTHLSKIMEQVQAGETVTVTKHGQVIATITGAKARDPEKIKAAIERIKEFRSKVKPDTMTIREMIDWGRRY